MSSFLTALLPIPIYSGPLLWPSFVLCLKCQYSSASREEAELMSKKTGTVSRKDFFRDYLLSLVLELVILFALMMFCSLFIYKGKLVGECRLIGGEMSSPTTGRLLYFILSFILAFALWLASVRCAGLERDVPAFWLGYTAGILLWQAVGEEAWHFSVGGINFVQLESIASFPLVLLFVTLLVYGYRRRAFDWGSWITIVSFACNWLGHYVTVGIYPFVEQWIDSRSWNVGAGISGGGLVLLISIFYLRSHGTSRKGRMFASMLTYIAIGITALSIIDG